MKKTIKHTLFKLVQIDFFWSIIAKTIIYPSQLLRSLRMNCEADRIIEGDKVLREAIRNRTVLSGPFKGMMYGNLEAHCSALHPKLLGCYEMELIPTIREAIEKRYSVVVDVGAAEGFYAIGLAMRISDAKVIAYEQEEDARKELAALAKLNHVADRIEIRERCEPQDLASLGTSGGLLILDCEGYEDKLLSKAAIATLCSWDFLIETHDGIIPEVTQRLEERFRETHRTSRIEIINDLNRANHFELDAISGLTRRQKDRLLAEGRQHATVRWLVCHSKTAAL